MIDAPPPVPEVELERTMSLFEASAWLALGSGILAYVLPVILWTRRPNFPLELFLVPAFALASWLVVEYFDVGPKKVGFTFPGAIAVAVMSDVLVIVLLRVGRSTRRYRLLCGFGVVALSIALGIGLRIVLPALPE
jgi:hypothetical protein